MKNAIVQGYNRTKEEEKIKLATVQKKMETVVTDKIVELIKESLQSVGISEKFYKICDIHGLKEIREWEKSQDDGYEKRSVFISFTEDNRVAVVGAGEKGVSFCKIEENSRYRLARLMASCDCKWPRDEEKRIVRLVFSSDFCESIHRSTVANILKCRDGIEFLLGEIIIQNRIPIIDVLSHRNWKYEYWSDVKNRNFDIL